MKDTKLKVKLKSSAHKNKSLSATLLSNDTRKVIYNPQEQGITVAPLKVEVWVSIRDIGPPPIFACSVFVSWFRFSVPPPHENASGVFI
jgi:hypothetical protein